MNTADPEIVFGLRDSITNGQRTGQWKAADRNTDRLFGGYVGFQCAVP